MQTEVEGIILKETLYSETSKVIQLLTKEYGLIGVLAKGALSLKSNLRSLTIPFLYGKFNIIYKKDKLSILKSGTLIKLYGFNNTDLKKYAYLSYLSELTYNVSKESNDALIFDIYKDALDKISEGFSCRVIKNIVEFKYLNFLGIEPNFDICQICGESKNFIAIDGKRGGFVCHDCYTNEKKIPDDFKKIINRYQDVDIKTIKNIKINDEYSKIVDEFLKEYYEQFSAVYINSFKFLDNFKS